MKQISSNVFANMTGMSKSDQFVLEKQYPKAKVLKTPTEWYEILKNDFNIPIPPPEEIFEDAIEDKLAESEDLSDNAKKHLERLEKIKNKK